MSHFSDRADLVSILEVAYSAEPDDERWAQALALAVQGSTATSFGTGVVAMAHGSDYVEPTLALHVCTDDAWKLFTLETWQDPPNAAMKGSPEVLRTFYPGRPYMTHSLFEPQLPLQAAELLRMSRRGAADACALFAYPVPGLAVVLWSMLGQVDQCSRREREALCRLASHLETALRLRIDPPAVVAAVLSPRGELLSLDNRSLESHRGKLTSRLRAIDAARTNAQRRTPEALDAWQSLIGGRFSLVPREDSDGKRHYLLVENAPAVRSHSRLSKLEVDAVMHVARGLSGKGAAYALGIGQGALSNALLRAANKLGLRSRAALTQIAAALFGVPSRALNVGTLSAAERDVLGLLSKGLSNAEIASLRGRSVNTVANQVSSILTKTGSEGRHQLFGVEPGAR